MKSARVIHPFLFAIYPMLVIVSLNLWQITLWEVVRLFFCIFLFCCVLFLLFQVRYKNWQRAGFLTSITLILVLYVDYSAYIQEKIGFAGIFVDRYLIIYIFWGLVLMFANSRLLWGRIRPSIITRYFNVTAFLLILVFSFKLWPLVNSYVKDPLRGWYPSENSAILTIDLNKGALPDIYYIIVDGYARTDVLNEIYNYDNSDFIDYLKNKNFYLAEQSQSNYIQTSLSLSSSLNYEYLKSLEFAANKSLNRDPLRKLIQHSKVRAILETAGYEIITLKSGYYITEIKDADLYLSQYSLNISNLETLFIDTTGFHIVFDSLNLSSSLLDFEVHRNRILYEFEQLGKISGYNSENPKFIFAHIVLPRCHSCLTLGSDS